MNLTIDFIAPRVRFVRYNTSPAKFRSFIDQEYVFTYINAGCGLYIIEGEEYQTKAGDMLLFAPYMLHLVKSDPCSPLEQYVVHFDLFFDPKRNGVLAHDSAMNFSRFCAATDNPETLLAKIAPIRSNPPEPQQGRVVRNFHYLAELFNEKKNEYTLLHARSAMVEILAIYLELSAQMKTNKRVNHSHHWRNIERALHYIHSHFNQPITLMKISREARISTTYFCTLFKNHTGQSVYSYLNELRIYKAKRLIEESDFTFTKIAQLTCLGDIHAFSKNFKKQEKVSPSEYRKAVRLSSTLNAVKNYRIP